MTEAGSKLLAAIQSKFEAGTIFSILVATSTYVGNFFYKSYFDFYFIDSADITIPLADSVRTFLIILAVSSLLIGMVATAERHARQTFATVLVDNLPVFILVMLLSAWAIDIYWNNVGTLSSWLSGALKDSNLREQNAQLTLQVQHFLKSALLIGPPLIAATAVLGLSFKRISFSRLLLAQSLSKRLTVLCIFVLLALNMASMAGKLFAFMEFTGIVAKSEIRITLTDGNAFQDGHVLYMVTRSGGIFYVAAKSRTDDHRVRAWQVAQPAVRFIEVHAPTANPAPFLEYLK